MKRTAVALIVCTAFTATGCLQPSTGTATGDSVSGGSYTVPTPTTATTSSSAATNVVKILTSALASTGSFDPTYIGAASSAGFLAAKRLYDINGNAYTSTTKPSWFVGAYVYLTATRTSATSNPGTPGAPTSENTPCAYFDTYADNNPGNAGFYTIDGFYSSNLSTTPDVDQCAGASATEQNNLKLYFVIDRSQMGSNDKLNIIVTASPLDAPNTTPIPSGCITGGSFDPSACTNQLFTISMRGTPTAANPAPSAPSFMPAKPFFMLFPSAKALDLISETVFLPINALPGMQTITIDRVKGGAIFHNVTIIRMN